MSKRISSGHRALSLLLAFLMACGMVPLSVLGIFATTEAEGGSSSTESTEVPAYRDLYAQQDKLLYLWMAEDLTPGETVTSLPNMIENTNLAAGEENAIDNLIRGDQYVNEDSAFGAEHEDDGNHSTVKTVTADGKAVAGDGFWKLDLTKFIPTTAGNYDDSVTLEVLQTNYVLGEDRTEANGHVNRKMMFLGMGKLTYHLDVGNSNGTNFSHVGTEIHPFYDGLAPTIGKLMSAAVDSPFTFTFVQSHANGASCTDQRSYIRYDFYRDGYVPSDNSGYKVEENHTGGEDRNNGTGGERAGLRSLSYGIGYESEGYSVIRLYGVALTAAEIMQNHFIDICFMHEIDLTSYMKVKENLKIAVHQLTEGKTAADFTKQELQEAIDAKCEELGAPPVTLSDYYTLYARQDKLTFLWTAETLTAGEDIAFLSNLVDGDDIVATSNGGKSDQALHNADIPLSLVASADGKYAIGDGQNKLALENVVPTTDGVLDRDMTFEVLQTYIKGGDRTQNNGWVNQYMWIGPFMAIVYHLDTPGTDGPNFSHMSICTDGYSWPQYKDSLGMLFSAEIGESFTLSYEINYDADASNPGGPYTEINFSRDANTQTKFGLGINYNKNDDKTNTATPVSDRAHGKWGFTYGIGYEQEAYSAIRIYDCILTDAEKEQNHFIDIAYLLDADLTFYREASDEAKAKIHKLAVGRNASDFTTESFEEAVNSLALTDGMLESADIENYIAFEGVQVRVNDYAAARLIYKLNASTVKVLNKSNLDYTFGFLYGDAATLSASDMEVVYDEDAEAFVPKSADYQSTLMIHKGVYGEDAALLNLPKAGECVGVTLPIVEAADFGNEELLNKEYVMRVYFAMRIRGESIVSYIDFSSALFGNTLSIQRANDHFLCNGYANSEVLSALADETLLYAALAGHDSYADARGAYDEIIVLLEEIFKANDAAFGIYDDYLDVRALIDNSLDVKNAIQYAPLYSNTKTTMNGYVMAITDMSEAISAFFETMTPKVNGRYQLVYDALIAKGLEEADAETLAAKVTARMQQRYDGVLADIDKAQSDAVKLGRFNGNIASASCANILKSKAPASSSLYLEAADISGYTIVTKSAYADAVAEIQEFLYTQYGALVGVYYLDNTDIPKSKTPVFEKTIYLGVTRNEINRTKHTYSVYFADGALYVEANDARALVAGVVSMTRTYAKAEGANNVTAAKIGQTLLRASYSPLVYTNAPVGLPGKVTVSSIDANGVWESFLQTLAEKPDEITVLDKYDITGYESSAQKTYFVATDGNDQTGDGTIEKPFASINRALKELEYSKGGTIYVRGGEYALTSSIKVEAQHSGTENSPLIIAAYEDEEVVFTTGESISGELFVQASQASFLQQRWVNNLNTFTPGNADNVYVVDLKAAGFAQGHFGSMDFNLNVFIDGNTGHMARWPNLGVNDPRNNIVNGEIASFDSARDIINVGYISDTNMSNYEEHMNDPYGFEIYIDRTKYMDHLLAYDAYNDQTNLEGRQLLVMGAHFEEWYVQRHGLQIFEDAKGRPYIRANKGLNIGVKYHSGNRCYFENMLEDLDNTNEYIFDTANMLLYVYAPGGLAGKSVVVGNKNIPVLSLQRVKHVVLDGLNITSSLGQAITMQNTEHVVYQNSTLKGIRGSTLGQSIAMHSAKECALIYNQFIDCAKVYLSSPAAKFEACGNIIQNNYFEWMPGGVGGSAIALEGVGDVFSHNYVLDTGIGLQGFDNIIEYNIFEHGSQKTVDNGPIYGGSQGSHIRNNYFKDLNYSTYGIYMDDTTSGNYIYNNVIEYDPTLANGKCINLHTGSRMVVYNNICINASLAGIMNNLNYYAPMIDGVSAGGGGFNFATLIKKNYIPAYNALDKDAIISRFPLYYANMQIMLQAYDVIVNDPDRDPTGNNMRSEEDAAEIYVRQPKFNIYKNNIFYKCANGLSTSDLDLSTAINQNNITYTEDPGFVDFENGNYNLREDATVFGDIQGFQAINMDKMGMNWKLD